MCMVFSDSLIQTSEEALVERVQERDQKDDGRQNRVYQAEGGGPGQQRDSLQSEANYADGKTEGELQREGGVARYLIAFLL